MVAVESSASCAVAVTKRDNGLLERGSNESEADEYAVRSAVVVAAADRVDALEICCCCCCGARDGGRLLRYRCQQDLITPAALWCTTVSCARQR